MKALKVLAFTLGGIVAIAVAAAAFIALTVDTNRIKSEVIQIVKDKRQRTLKLEGEAALSFWPDIGFRLEKAALSEHNSDQEFAALDSARISVALLPLLKKQLVIDRVELTGVKAVIVRRKDGTFNFDDLLTKDKEESPMLRFDVASVKLTDAQLAYHDEQSGQTIVLSGLGVSTGHLGNAAQDKFELSAKIAGDKPKMTADVKLSGRYRYDLEQKLFGLNRLDAKLNGALAGMNGLELALAAGALQLQSASGTVEVEKLELSAKGKTGEDGFEIKVNAPRFAASAEKTGGEAFSAEIKLAGAQRNIAANLNFSGVEGASKQLKIAKIALTINGKQGETTVKGALESSLVANFKTQLVELPKFSGEFDVASPQMPMKSVKLPLTGSARADLAKKSAAGEFSARFDESNIHAKWIVAKFTPLALNLNLDIDQINVDKYLPPKPAAAIASAASGAPSAADKPLDFSALQGLNLSGAVKIGKLQVSNIKANNVRLELKAANGQLDISPLSANLYQGSMSGAASVNASGNRVALKQTLTGVAVNPLMKDAIDKDMLEGRGTVALDISGSGKTVGQLKQSLNGSASLKLINGAVKGINLAQSLRDMKSKLSLKQDVTVKANQTQKTDFSELAATFKIANGVAHNDDLAAKSPFLRLGGAGDIDIGAGNMNYLAKATVVGSSTGQEGKELAELKGITVPVRLSGPLENVSYKLEFGSLLAEAAKVKVGAKVEEKKQEIQQKAQDTVKDKLKGLLQR